MNQPIIDLRSDTVTQPTPAMRQAMADAPLGDDVYGEDPTVNRLQELAAQRFGKEAALFVASGTMGNVISLLAHCERGDRAMMGDKAHTYLYEGGNPATLGGVHSWLVPVQPDGKLRLEDLQDGIGYRDDSHYSYAKLVCLENTQGGMGGQPLDAAYIAEVGAFCQQNDLLLHIDGARIFNATAALQTPVSVLAAHANSVSFCLSKGLCAPVGSLIVGSAAFIRKAHRIRKALGGGMRQAGVLAAAGIIALQEMTERLADDHANAQMLAEGLARIPCVAIDPARVRTNMVFFDLHPDAPLGIDALMEKLAADGILIGSYGSTYKIRAVTHYWITPEQIERVVGRIAFHLS